MAENIDGTTGGSTPYNTSIPELADDADIQEALRIYHYGAKTPPTLGDAPSEKSIAGHFGAMSNRVTFLENQGIGSSYLANEPESIPNGYIWVNADSAAPIFGEMLLSVPSVAKYLNSAPTSQLVDGMQWIDKDDPFLSTYVYDKEKTPKWTRANQPIKYQDDAPDSANIPDGALWIDKNDPVLSLYVYDAEAFDWKEIGSTKQLLAYKESAPSGTVVDGSLWVDKDDAFLTMYVYDQGTTSWIRSNQIAKYQDAFPTGNIIEGSLWVDKDSVPLKMYVYDTTDGWREIGA